jgi:hypothetical protein
VSPGACDNRRCSSRSLGALRLFLKSVAIPLAIALAVVAVVYAAVYAGSARRAKRYRPGRPFEFTPVWFLAAPEKAAPALTGRDAHALTGAPAAAEASTTPAVHGETGGASDRW